MTFTPDSSLVTHVVPAHPTNIYDPANHGGVPNHPRGLVLHTPQEPADDYESTPVYFSQPNRQASTHYYADNDGDIFQMVPERFGAIANGLRNKPRPAWADPNTSLNWQTLSIEIEGYAATINNTVTLAQTLTVARWIADCARRYRIPVDRQHIIGHYEVADNRSDPGTLDIEGLVLLAQTLAAPPKEEDCDVRLFATTNPYQVWAVMPSANLGGAIRRWVLNAALLAERQALGIWPSTTKVLLPGPDYDRLMRIPQGRDIQ